MNIDIKDRYLQRGYPPVLVEMDTTIERRQGIISLYDHLIKLINAVKQIDPSWEDNIEHIFFGNNELIPDENKSVIISNNLKDYINTITQYQNAEEVTSRIQELMPKRVTDLVDADDWATKAFTRQLITDLIDGAPEALDTLKEIADMLQDDTDGIAAIINRLNQKANKTEVFTKEQSDERYILKSTLLYTSLYIGCGSTIADITEAMLHTDVYKGSRFTLVANNNHIYLLTPTAYGTTPYLTLSGLEIPMTQLSNIIKNDIEYNVFESNSIYSIGNITVSVL